MAFTISSRHRHRTPMRILKQIRLERSLDSLRREDSSVGKVASAVGFGDARNFGREFKKSYGLTPLQYKQQSQLNLQTETLVNKADGNMNANVFRRASILYLQAIEDAPVNMDLNELYYKAGLALTRAGDGRKAGEIWSNVTALYYRLRIDLEKCEHYSKSANYERVVDKLRRVYEYGDHKLRKEAVSQLSKWMIQCAQDFRTCAE